MVDLGSSENLARKPKLKNSRNSDHSLILGTNNDLLDQTKDEDEDLPTEFQNHHEKSCWRACASK